MREELYRKLKTRLEALCINAAGEYYERPDEADMDDELYPRVIKHIDLWNHNVEFLEQEAPWPRPAVFIEFVPFKWHAVVPGVEYRAQPLINLHVVTDWAEQNDIGEFRLLDKIHKLLAGLEGENFMEFDIDSSATNHNHEDIVENIETYTCVGFRHLK
ncbi:hypothetical protein [Paramuribaculum intestinale]|uniref:hypothetical protein n=1 Tax=Paramuribaculum intestinale TaxID=2094151 RepID=UPI0025B6A664|nr:hypothetical protein [Paramuribaculum intestinale]